MRGRAAATTVLGTAVLVTGCSTWRPALLRRASFDMQCAEEQIAIQELGTMQFGVEGCGCRATYVSMGNNRFVLNNHSGSCEMQHQGVEEGANR